MPTEDQALRRSLEQWFAARAIRPRVVGEFDDSALLKVFAQAGRGLFAGPEAVERQIARQYGVRVVGRCEGVRERFFAISAERRLAHPAVVTLTESAREKLFS
jgi:LysR family transcriptional activator of nhaA